MTPAAFAIPGDITTPTGGYIYERRLLKELRAAGRAVRHLRFGGSFPDPTPTDMADAVAQLCALPAGCPVILDGFVSATLDTQALARLAAPTVAMVHHPLALETGLTEARRAHLYALEQTNLALIPRVLVPSPHTAEILTARYAVPASKITIARPGTDPPARPLAQAHPPLILSVGLQHPRKGHDVLLRALAQLPADGWRAEIVGTPHDPEHAAHLQDLVQTLGLSPRVRLRGHVPQEDLAELYAAAAVFALATRYEGYGLVFDEALSYGLPIVSCAVGAVPDTVPPAAGVLVRPDAPGAVAEALGALLADPGHRAARAAAAKAAGRALPRWSDTARTVGTVLDALGRS